METLQSAGCDVRTAAGNLRALKLRLSAVFAELRDEMEEETVKFGEEEEKLNGTVQ